MVLPLVSGAPVQVVVVLGKKNFFCLLPLLDCSSGACGNLVENTCL
jgi:hypothetical protein